MNRLKSKMENFDKVMILALGWYSILLYQIQVDNETCVSLIFCLILLYLILWVTDPLKIGNLKSIIPLIAFGLFRLLLFNCKRSKSIHSAPGYKN